MLENQTEYVRARISPKVKEKAETILEKLGLGHTEAIRLFYQQIILNQGLPFNVNIPNKETRKAMEQVRSRKGLRKITIEQLRKEFDVV